MHSPRINSSIMSESDSLSHTTRSSDHIEHMQGLLREIINIQKENTDVDKGMQRVQEIIVESSKVVENSTSTSEMIVDAKILHTGTSVVNTNVSSLNTNLTSFSETKYVSGIQSYMENSDHVVLVGKEWECLAPFTYSIFRKSHPVTFMLGPFTLESPVSKEQSRAEKQEKEPEPQKTSLTTVQEKEKPQDEGSDIYDHILKWLVRHYKRNERQPINYFNFIINPTDYWQTVENIFHFAFLVRDGSVKMGIVGGLPFVEPVLRNSSDKGQKSNNNYQFCFSISKAEWRKCIQKFNIKTPSIPPFVRQS